MEDNIKLLQELKEYWDVGKREYTKDLRRMKALDMTDRGDLWRAIGKQFPAYQILPDTNFVSYLKANLVASIYTVTKSAEILPTSEQDKDLCVNLNVALAHLWIRSASGSISSRPANERRCLTSASRR